MRGKVKVWNRIFRYDICYDVPTILFFAGFFLHEISVIMDSYLVQTMHQHVLNRVFVLV